MTEYIHELKIPRDRIAVLIGTKGEMKRHLEDMTGTAIEVDSSEGDILVKGEDTLKVYNTSEIVKAIGRGFNPEHALELLKPDFGFDIISLNEYTKHKHHMLRLKGRVIGAKGKARNTIEELTGTHICVYGKTIGIIGEMTGVAAARRALDSLLKGSMHSTVYRWLEKNRARKEW